MLRQTRVAAALSVGVILQTWPAAQAVEIFAARTGAAPLLAQIPQSQRVDSAATLQLKVRRLPDAIELIIEGTGPAPQLQQSSSGTSWQGQLVTAMPAALRVGPQRLALPEVGLQSISFDGLGQSFAITVTPAAGITLGRPVVSADGRNLIVTFASPVPQASLQTSRLNMAQPGAVPLPTFAPPLQPRAVAPPLGDMAVGSMTLRNPGYLNLSGPPVTMTLKNAPAKDALMALAQMGGYGFAYVAEPTKDKDAPDPGSGPLSLSFRGESFGRAFNAALLASGLQGRREGNMILAGPNALSKSFGPQLSKIYRLNQAGPLAAADYLATLGATVMRVDTITTSVSQGVTQDQAVAGAPATSTTESEARTFVEEYRATAGPLVGLRVTSDTRLGTITLVGDPAIVSVAEQYLRKLDLRQRQVALNVRILDVNLDNVSEIDNSFAIRWGNNFIVNDRGQLLGAFGQNLPPDATAFRRDVPREIEFQDGTFTVEGGAGGLGLNAQGSTRSLAITLNNNRQLDRSTVREIERETGSRLERFTPSPGAPPIYLIEPIDTNISRAQRNIQRILGRSASVERVRASADSSLDVGAVPRNPGRLYDSDTFFDFVRAQIVSGSTKLLASPTLILQDNPSLLREGTESVAAATTTTGQQATQGIVNIGLDGAIGRRRANEGVVRVGTNVVTGYETETPSQGGNVVCTPQLSTAGLVLGARVEKIDDNGFVTFTLSPSVSAITAQEFAPQGCGSNLNILSVRSLDTGALRVRDGQTLIMTGVISDFDRQEVSKWPILGDMPLIGQFFRSTTGRKEKRELVIMVTPRIVNDEQGGVYGYGYQPGTSAGREFFGSAVQGDGLN